MKLHLVGGFLGSGKTTAIIQAARLLTASGQRVGIITNEQGKNLVDTRYMLSEGLHALEVTEGCICCHLDDFEERIEEIVKRFDPQVIFAESVGSCTDLVATVIKPLKNIQETTAYKTSLSVFTDSRLLLRYLRGQELPFSEGVTYIFEKQIEEAGLLVINKIDLLPASETSEILGLAKSRYKDKNIRLQNSLEVEEIRTWLSLIESESISPPALSLDLDYDTYALNEGKFVWLDRGLEIVPGDLEAGKKVSRLVEDIVSIFASKDFSIGHLKFLVEIAGKTIKLNITSLDVATLRNQVMQLEPLSSSWAFLLMNAMVIGDRELVEDRLSNALKRFELDHNTKIELTMSYTRVPEYPRPTMRIED